MLFNWHPSNLSRNIHNSKAKNLRNPQNLFPQHTRTSWTNFLTSRSAISLKIRPMGWCTTSTQDRIHLVKPSQGHSCQVHKRQSWGRRAGEDWKSWASSPRLTLLKQTSGQAPFIWCQNRMAVFGARVTIAPSMIRRN